MKLLLHLAVSTIAVLVASYVLSGVHVSNVMTAVIVAIVLGVINAVVRPILGIITLPINLVSFGLFSFVLNALLIQGTALLVPGFSVDGFLWALAFGFVLSLVQSILHQVSRA